MSKSLRNVTDLIMNKNRKSANSAEHLSTSYESFSNPDYVLTGDADLAQECYDIVNTYNSVEELDRLFMNQHNDLAVSVEMFNSEILNYYNNRKLTKNFIQKFKDHEKGLEAASNMINIMSLESVGSFMKKSWEVVKQFFKKLITQALKLIKMFTTFVRGKLAASQSSLYTKLSGNMANLLKANGSKTAVYKMFDKKAISNIPSMTSKLISATNKFEQDIDKTFNTGSGLGNVAKNVLGIEKSVPSAIKDINSALGVGGEAENTRAAVNKIFFGEAKQPKAAEHKISDLLSVETFKAASKEWLNSLHELTKSANSMTKQCNKVIKKIESFEKDIIKDKEGDDASKAKARGVLANVNAIRMKMQVFQMYIRDYFWTALDYRSTICSLAKKVNNAGKADEKAAKKASK